MSTDRLDLLRLFIHIAERGKISEAAEIAGISQPSASRLLKKLEALLGAQLMHRTGAGVTITTIGSEVLISARHLLRHWDGVVGVSDTHHQRLTGHIRIVTAVALGEALLASLIARFIRKHPGVTIDCDLRDDQIDLGATGYDLWVRVGRIKSDRLVVREIAGTPRAVFCSPRLGTVSHPRLLQNLRAVRVAPFVQETVKLLNDADESFLLRQSCALTTNSLFAAHTATLEGIGFAVLPLWLTELDVTRGRLIQTCPSWKAEPLTLSLAFLPGRGRPARITAIAQFLQKELSNSESLHAALFNRLRGES